MEGCESDTLTIKQKRPRTKNGAWPFLLLARFFHIDLYILVIFELSHMLPCMILPSERGFPLPKIRE